MVGLLTRVIQLTAGHARSAGRFEEAASLFSTALQHADESSSAGSVFAAKLYANRAQCCLKLCLPEAAEINATCALAADPAYAKAYYRRACARKALGIPRAAAADVRAALQNTAASLAEVQELRTLLRELEAMTEDGCSTVECTSDSEERSSARDSEEGEGRGRGNEKIFESLWEERAGSKLQVAQLVGVGRFCVAKCDLVSGQELLCDKAFDAVVV